MKSQMIRNCIGFLSVICLCVNSVSANAQDIPEFDFGSDLSGEWNIWKEEGGASLTMDGNAAHIEVDGAGDENMQNVVIANFIAEDSIVCRKSSGIAMAIANPSDALVYVAFQTGNLQARTYTLPEDGCIITYANGTARTAALSDYGTIQLQPHSNTRIVLPLQLFTQDEELIPLETLLYGYLLVFNVMAGESYSIDIADVQYVDGDSGIIPEEFDAKILGSSEIQLPYQGEKVYQYSLSEKSGPIAFVEQELGPGLTITSDGKLTITNQAAIQDITISAYAEDAQVFVYEKTVSIVENYGMRNNLENFFISPQDEVEIPYESIAQYSNRIVHGIRVVLILGSLTMLIACCVTLITHKEKTNGEKGI